MRIRSATSVFGRSAGIAIKRRNQLVGSRDVVDFHVPARYQEGTRERIFFCGYLRLNGIKDVANSTKFTKKRQVRLPQVRRRAGESLCEKRERLVDENLLPIAKTDASEAAYDAVLFVHAVAQLSLDHPPDRNRV